ncbi:hypothetical protein VC83_00228 [Pseudogymnoascus destructans]|uniref:SET domain-containing protein n=2 Tax=Pseudogymnoascus destructans TaxID=655981 RepID=L8GEK4_PSED2|nr:uncharacterized protein VC83_00228 [Pseudogymnoascus destructans]ELR10576.1 hypothetical protein GMDG_04849 [Pseudogymnoascus destructans 20631-21]OAF62896.1 hypothetical protein VC83_00228 [Pseudogymnoascus destructans]
MAEPWPVGEPQPVIIPMLEEYSDGTTSCLAQCLLEEIYRDYHSKRFTFIVAPERRLVPIFRWHKDMRSRINILFSALSGPQRYKIVFVAILSISPAFIEALRYAVDDLWTLLVGHLTANKSSIEFFARSRGLPWLRAVRELIPGLCRRDPEPLLSSFTDHIVGLYPTPNSISDEVLHQNLNAHGPDTYYLSMTGAIVPILAPSYNDAQPSDLQVIDIEECTYDPALFYQYDRTPDWPWQTWPRQPQICDAPDIDGVYHEPPRCVKCDHRFSGEEDWHNPFTGCQCHDMMHAWQGVLIQIVEYPPFPDQPNVVNRGVRALQALAPKALIGEYTGVLVPNADYDPHSEICDNTYLFGLYDQTYRRYVAAISARLCGNWTRFINHTDDEDKQNVKFINVRILNRLRVMVMTTKQINLGEEILGHYGEGYFKSRQF